MNVKIAIPHADGEIFQHFGSAKQFKFYVVEDDRVVSSEVVDAACSGHDEIGLWLVQHEVNAVVCGNIGPGALGALTAAGILALAGVEGTADGAIAKLVAGELEATTAPNCTHHTQGGCHSHCAGRSGGCSGSCAGCRH